MFFVGSAFTLNNRNKDIGSLNTKDTFAIYNYLCSLLSYSVNLLKTDISIIVLIDATKISVKALRLILKACQNVLAFRNKRVIITEPDSFFDQQRLSLDILLESYDFKVIFEYKIVYYYFILDNSVFKS